MPFLSLPADILIHLLLLIDGLSVIRCKQVCKTLSLLIEGNIEIQYNLELYRSSYIDLSHHHKHNHSRPTIPKKDRLNLLQQLHTRRQEWGSRWPEETIPDTNLPGTIWDWSWEYQGRVLACLMKTSEVWCFEFSTKEAVPYRKRVVKPLPQLGHPNGLYIDPKQDLLVIMDSANPNDEPPFRIHLLSLSNGAHHTGCNNPLLVLNDYLGDVQILYDSRIYGHLLAFAFLRDGDISVAVFDWRLGELKAVIDGRSFMFIDTTHILVDYVNLTKLQLELHVYAIGQSTTLLLILPFPARDRYDLEFGRDVPLPLLDDASVAVESHGASPAFNVNFDGDVDVDQDDGYPFTPDRELTMITVSIRLHQNDQYQVISTFPAFVIQKLLLDLTNDSSDELDELGDEEDHDSSSSTVPIEIPWGSWPQCTFLWPNQRPQPTSLEDMNLCTSNAGCRIALAQHITPASQTGTDFGSRSEYEDGVVLFKFHPRWFHQQTQVRNLRYDLKKRLFRTARNGGGVGKDDEDKDEELSSLEAALIEAELETEQDEERMHERLLHLDNPSQDVDETLTNYEGGKGWLTSLETLPLPPVESMVQMKEGLGRRASYGCVWMDEDLLILRSKRGIQFVRA